MLYLSTESYQQTFVVVDTIEIEHWMKNTFDEVMLLRLSNQPVKLEKEVK